MEKRQRRESENKIHASIIRYAKTVFNAAAAAAALSTVVTSLRQSGRSGEVDMLPR